MASASAINLTYVQPGIITRDGAGDDHLDKELDAMIARVNRDPAIGDRFFRVVSNVRTGTYKESTVGNALELPHQNEDTDDIPFVTPAEGYSKEFTIVNYRLGVRVERSLMEDELFGKVRYMLNGLPMSARRLQEYSRADILNNAFATNIGADGMYLCDTSHPNENRATGTWDNLQSAAALSHTTFSTARTSMRKRTNERGQVSPVMAKVLLVPPDLEEEARVIVASEKQSGVAINNKNVFQGSVEVVVWDYLTSTTAWFLLGDLPKDSCGMLYVNKVAPNVAPVTSTNPDVLMSQRLRMRFAVGFTTEKNIEGNAGA